MNHHLINDLEYQRRCYAGQTTDVKLNLFKIGQAKRLNNMKRRLSAFFRFTREEGRYAQNWTSKGALVPALITLTYPANEYWKPEHITKFINHLRNYAKRNWGEKLRYTWVAETTKKGVIHYHVVVWHPRKEKFPKPDKQGWWPHGISQIAGVRKGVYDYLVKYISKGSDMAQVGLVQYSKSGRRQAIRIFGYGGLLAKDREFLTHQMLPHYIKSIFGPIPFGQTIKRVKGGWQCGKTFVSSNFESYWDELNKVMVYEYGRSWCEIPDDHMYKDIWIPF